MLLILAGVSIATLTGDNGILTQAQKAKTTSEAAEIEEQIKLAITYARMNDKNDLSIDTQKLLEELQNNGIEVANSESFPWTVTKGNYAFEIAVDGTVTKQGASIIVSNIVVKNGDTVVEANSKSVATGTPLTISFDASIAEGNITSIAPSLPYTPNSDSVKTKETFTITGTDKDGKTITKEYTLNLKGYYNIPELKVGDYISNYTPTIRNDAEIDALNAEINANSGANDYTTDTTKYATALTQETPQWRVLETDKTTGEPTKLISAETVGNMGLYGANGYNNAVYLLNKACNTLYSGEFGEARSLKIEDIEYHLNDTGKAERDGYTNASTELKYRETKRYTGGNANYPKIALEEKDMGINTTPLDESEKNPIREGGIDLSEQTQIYNTGEDKADNGITITQKYWYSTNLSNIYTDSIYKELFHDGGSSGLASRCVRDYGSYCSFEIHHVNSSNVGAGPSYYSKGGLEEFPVVFAL